MRHLLQPCVLGTASAAALVSALACYPRLTLWVQRPGPLWYLEATIFICCIMLWGFVFAWHEPYTHRPVFVRHLELVPLVAATVAGLAVGAVFHWWIDPSLRAKFPEEYPPDLAHWLAAIPFVLAFNQLFLVFAPFDWLMRLTKSRWLAAGIIGLWRAILLLLNMHRLQVSISPSLLTVLLAGRMTAGFFVVWLYWRGGVFLVGWWVFLLECRHLPDLLGRP